MAIHFEAPGPYHTGKKLIFNVDRVFANIQTQRSKCMFLFGKLSSPKCKYGLALRSGDGSSVVDGLLNLFDDFINENPHCTTAAAAESQHGHKLLLGSPDGQPVL